MRWLARYISFSQTVAVLCASSVAVLAGCKPRDLPGEPIGVYRVVGTLEENSCGSSGLPASNPFLFEVEIRDDEGIGVWALTKKPFILGTIKHNGEFLFRLEDRFTVSPEETEAEPEPDPEFFYDPETYSEPRECYLSQVEVIEGTVVLDAKARYRDGGVDGDVDLLGSDSIEIQPTSNADCRDLLVSAGGPFATLPCQAVYTLEGELSDEE